MSTQITTLGIKIITKGADKAKKEINSIGTAASKVKSKIGLIGGALAALGVVKALKDSIKYTASIEDLGIQLKFLTGSTKNASKAFAEMTKFASETPFSIREIQKSSASLLVAVGNDVSKLGNILKITGEISAQFGLSFEVTAGQLQRAMSAGAASADIFREKGVNAMMGFRVGVKHSIEDTTRIINKWAEDNKGAIEELKNTFTGKVSMMSDAWDKVLLTFGQAGVLDGAKDAVQSITNYLKDPETIKSVESMADGFLKAGKNLKIMAGSLFTVVQLIKIVGDEMAGKKWFPATEFYFEKSMLWLKGMTLMYDGLNAAANQYARTFGNFKPVLDPSPSIPAPLPLFTLPPIADMGKFSGEIRKFSAEFLNTINASKIEIETIVLSPKEAEKLERKQEQNVDKIIGRVINITDKLTKKRTELEKITDEQIIAERILGKELKETKITLEQYTHGINIMKTNIQDYANVIEQIAFDKKMEKMAQNMEDSITDSLMNMGRGLNSFKDLATSIFRDIATEMVRVQISRPIASAASGFLGDVFGSMFGKPAAPTSSAGLPHATFAGGGFTGSGSRSGGLDNQGGFPAILHPNETIIDHSKGQSAANVNNITVNYSPQVNALDPRTAAMVIAENAPLVVGIIRQAFGRNGQSVSI